jgi:hypothetical protein
MYCLINESLIFRKFQIEPVKCNHTKILPLTSKNVKEER